MDNPSDSNLSTMDIANSSVGSNVTLASDDVRDESLARIEIGTLAVIFVLIVCGNMSVLIALVAGRLKMRRMYYFLLHLSIADLFTGFFTVLPQLAWDITYRFYGGNVMCKSIKYLQLLGPYLSSYVLVMTAIDRYQAICFPLANCTWTARRAKLMIGLAWSVSLICCTPQLLIFSYQQVDGYPADVYDCWGTYPQPWGERAYVTWYALSVFILPLIVLTFTYVCICRVIWLNAKRTSKCNKNAAAASSLLGYGKPHSASSSLATMVKQRSTERDSMEMNDTKTSRVGRGQRLIVEVGGNYRLRLGNNNKNVRCYVEDISTSSDDTTSRHSFTSKFNVNITPRSTCAGKLSRAKIKTIKITIVVIFCYIFCSLPFIAVQLWAYWWPGAQETSFWRGPVITISMLLSSLNSCVNPWIYLFFNRNLYLTLKNKCCHPCQRTKPSRTSGRLNDYHSSMHSECTGHTTNHQDSGRDRFDRLSIGSRSRHFHSRANSPRPSFDAGLLPIKATLLDADQHVDSVGQSQSNKVTSPEAMLATAVIETSA